MTYLNIIWGVNCFLRVNWFLANAGLENTALNNTGNFNFVGKFFNDFLSWSYKCPFQSQWTSWANVSNDVFTVKFGSSLAWLPLSFFSPKVTRHCKTLTCCQEQTVVLSAPLPSPAYGPRNDDNIYYAQDKIYYSFYKWWIFLREGTCTWDNSRHLL